MAVSPTCSFARTSPATNSTSRELPRSLGRPLVLKGRKRPELEVLSLPVPSFVRSALVRLQSEPYTLEASMKAVIVLICSRGLSRPVPVSGS